MHVNAPPLVTILIAVYNEELYIKECINSLLDQPYQNIEIIIVDDFSDDNTFSLIKSLEKNNPSIVKVFKNNIKGKAAAFSLAYEKSSGEFLTLLGGDDIVRNNYITSRIELLIKLHHEHDNKKNCILGRLISFSENKKFDKVISPKNVHNSNNYSGGLMMFTREFAEEAFPVPETLPSEDAWIGLHAKYFSKNMRVADIVINYRIHAGNTINRDAHFNHVSERISSRRAADQLFLKKYSDKLSRVDKKHVEDQITLEKYRDNGFSLKILLHSGIGLSDRLRAFFYSREILYVMRMKFFNILSGR